MASVARFRARSRGGLALLLTLPLPVLSPAGARGQVATVRLEENFRAEPNGVVLARVLPGTLLDVARIRGAWVEAGLEGWVWTRSLQVADGGGGRLVVSATGGENLRSEPRGTVLARLEEGMLLEELERRPGWIHVRRAGWIWGRSVDVSGAQEPEPSARASPSAEEAPGETAGRETTGSLTVPPRGLPILGAPDGDTLGRAVAGTDVQVLGREGGWARVRMEGWAWVGTGELGPPDSAAVPADVDPETVTREPDRFRGRLVTWTLRFVSLERAERVRTDFYEGEPYLLTRPLEEGASFVYVAIPPERLDEVADLLPYESIEVVGRIRSGASELTGSPILDLVELRR